MGDFHYYGSPGPFGVSCCPGPRSHPHIFQAKPAVEGGIPKVGLSSTKLMRSQQAVHEKYADHLLRQQHRALTGRIYGNPAEAGVRRSTSVPLIAAGASAAATNAALKSAVLATGLDERSASRPASRGGVVTPADTTIKFSDAVPPVVLDGTRRQAAFDIP
mmetsp:Transcript_10695/g.19427  ORF Transcript_10695/g.19427 Transcript_10695/m.19427 type:complete len:161 (-) Transcript_10695:58-540(-)